MSKWLVEKRLSVAADRLKRLRSELAVVDEQLAELADAADESRIRSLVSETPLADREHQEAQKHADAMARHRAKVVASISELERSRDDLLDQLLAETG
jgi:cell division septum initiation protein DivIVA